jgi:hypothetical protein
MLRRVAVVRTDDSEERIAFIVREKRISELGTMLTVIINSVVELLIMEAIRSCETSVRTRAT